VPARVRLLDDLAPWHLDPHCDHAAAARIAAGTARIAQVRYLSYPVWGWTLPADTVLDEAAVRGWRLDVASQLGAKRYAIAAHASQYGQLPGAAAGGRSPVGDIPAAMNAPRRSLGPAHFRRLYDANADPWQFCASAYEQAKYRETWARRRLVEIAPDRAGSRMRTPTQLRSAGSEVPRSWRCAALSCSLA
jgi:hypothetical protein